MRAGSLHIRGHPLSGVALPSRSGIGSKPFAFNCSAAARSGVDLKPPGMIFDMSLEPFVELGGLESFQGARRAGEQRRAFAFMAGGAATGMSGRRAGKRKTQFRRSTPRIRAP